VDVLVIDNARRSNGFVVTAGAANVNTVSRNRAPSIVVTARTALISPAVPDPGYRQWKPVSKSYEGSPWTNVSAS
jgi:hypothetical protein